MDLLEVLRLYKKETDKIADQESKIPGLPIVTGFWTRLIVSFLSGVFVSVLIETIFHIDFEQKYGGYGLLGMVTIPAAIIYAFWTLKVSKRKMEMQKKIQIEETKLEKIKLECQNNMKSIGVVPEYYHYREAINSFIHYIESMQASTLQECIRLYNENLRHLESMAVMEAINNNIDYLEDRLSSIETDVSDTNYRLRH
ncbi:hypothetical protein [Neobacillus sp. Marseille-QA0830]